MSQQVLSEIFVGRETEFARFETFLKSDKRLLLVTSKGKGGIGKTQVIQHLQMKYKDSSVVKAAGKLIDFYDTHSQSKLGVMEQIAENVGFASFAAFQSVLAQYRRAEAPDKRREALSEMEQVFLADYRKASQSLAQQGQTILLFFDTYEFVQGARNAEKTTADPTPFSQWLEKELFPELNAATRLVIAGRFPLTDFDSNQVDSLELAGFSTAETRDYWNTWVKYLQEEGNAGPINKLVETAQNTPLLNRIHHLAEGRPVLLALFADWVTYARNPLSPEELLSRIDAQSDQEADLEKELFEKALIQQIGSLITPEDRAVTHMAFAYRRMTTEMFSHIAGIPNEKAEEVLFKGLRLLSFVKYKEKEKTVLLHDEMRDLVVRHWWDEQDSAKAIRRSIAKRLIAYYDKLLLQKELPVESRPALTAERLYYALYLDVRDGLKNFIAEFQRQYERSDFNFCDLLVHEIMRSEFYAELSPAAQLEIDFKRVHLYNEWIQPGLALQILDQIKDNSEKYAILQGDKKLFVEFIHERGVANHWSNQFSLATKDFAEAGKIYRRDLKDDHEAADELTWLGYAYYRDGDFAKAEHTLQRSLSEFLRLKKSPELVGNIVDALSNLNVVMRHQGRYQEAVIYGEMAVALARRPRQKARFLNALAETYSWLDQTFEAAQRYKEALNILQEISDAMLEGRVRMGKGLLSYRNYYIYVLEYYRWGERRDKALQEFKRGEFFKPEAHELEKALDIFKTKFKQPTVELSHALFDLAEYKTIDEEWPEAIALFKESIQVAEQVQNEYRVMDALIGQLMALYYQAEKNPDLLDGPEIQAITQKIDELTGHHPYHNLQGKYHITKGDFAYEHYLLKRTTAVNLKGVFREYVLAGDEMLQFNQDRFHATLRIFLVRLNDLIFNSLRSISIDELETIREIWESFESEDRDRFVFQDYRNIFDEMMNIAGLRLQLGKGDSKERDTECGRLKKVIEIYIQEGRDKAGLTPLYGEMLLQLRLDGESQYQKARAYQLLGRTYSLNENLFEARKNYQFGIDLASDIQDDKMPLLKAQLLIDIATNSYRKGQYQKEIESSRRKELVDNLPEFRKRYKGEIDTVIPNLMTAKAILVELEKQADFSKDLHFAQAVYKTRADLAFRWGEFNVIMKPGQPDKETEDLFNDAITNAERGKNLWRQIDALESLITYYYFSGQWDIKKGVIKEKRADIMGLNEQRPSHVLLGRLLIAEGDAEFDQLPEEIKEHDLSANEKESLEKAFTSYIQATDYKLKYSDKHFYEGMHVLFARIAALSPALIKILYKDVYQPRLRHLRPANKIAEKAYELLEQFLYIRSELE